MSIQAQNPKPERRYDLLERLTKFSEEIIIFVRSLPVHYETRSLIEQLIRSATSMGANYAEADGAESKKDFLHKIAVCKKEAKETMYWLSLFERIFHSEKIACHLFWEKAHEFVLIFSAIFNNSRRPH